jgi:hypothetical protein
LPVEAKDGKGASDAKAVQPKGIQIKPEEAPERGPFLFKRKEKRKQKKACKKSTTGLYLSYGWREMPTRRGANNPSRR